MKLIRLKLPPRALTIWGLVVVVFGTVTDPALVPLLTEFLGSRAMQIITVMGGLMAALGRALIPPPVIPPPAGVASPAGADSPAYTVEDGPGKPR